MNKGQLKLRAGTLFNLTHYVAKQLHYMFPDGGIKKDIEVMIRIMPQVLERMRPVLGAVRAFEPDMFNHFNSLQYATFLYLLANEQWQVNPSDKILDRLFCLNRALNALDLFYSVKMPEVFFVSHGLGTVIGNAIYGDRFVFFQNVTVGRVGDNRPKIGKGVILYPGVIITGSTEIGCNSVVSAGSIIHGIEVPDNVLVMTINSELVFKPKKRDYINHYLR